MAPPANHGIALPCSVCGAATAAPMRRDLAGPRVAAFDSGGIRLLVAEPDVPLWLLFQLRMISCEGWDEAPAEILHSGFLHAECVDVLRREQASARVAVEAASLTAFLPR